MTSGVRVADERGASRVGERAIERSAASGPVSPWMGPRRGGPAAWEERCGLVSGWR